MEIENAVNQANKELANRFDFKGSKSEIVLEKNETGAMFLIRPVILPNDSSVSSISPRGSSLCASKPAEMISKPGLKPWSAGTIYSLKIER